MQSKLIAHEKKLLRAAEHNAGKFRISQMVAIGWLIFVIWLSQPWIHQLSQTTGVIAAYLIIAGIAYLPGYISAFTLTSLLLDKKAELPTANPSIPITILIAARNEEKGIGETLEHIARQEYLGIIKIILIDNGSTDRTVEKARQTAERTGLSLMILHEEIPGKHNALNRGLKEVNTPFLITLDADTFLHPSAIRFLAAKLQISGPDVHAVAGSLLVQNNRGSFLARVQEWEYYLSIASIKRMQSIYQSTLVAQGAFSIFRSDAVKAAGGWPDSIGEDIVLTWKFFENNGRVCFEPAAVAFTEVPESFIHLIRQRKRWARGMIEALKQVSPWKIKDPTSRFFTGLDLVVPYIDLAYTFIWIPGLFLCAFGYFGLVGPNTLMVLPVTLIIFYLLNLYQKRLLGQLGIHQKKSFIGLLGFIFVFQMIIAPVALSGYAEEFFKQKRVWK
ncbi:glycosyltransferase family 2 protein [Paenibacillus catalpae]|nr:glycosyltransferase [Paenibacillus catalpae]